MFHALRLAAVVNISRPEGVSQRPSCEVLPNHNENDMDKHKQALVKMSTHCDLQYGELVKVCKLVLYDRLGVFKV